MKRKLRLQQHVTNWYDCKRCPLGKTADTHVLYRGDIPAQVLFVGEAPGYSEDAVGKPFVGQSGRLLNDIIERTIERTKPFTFCVTNVLACIPHDSAKSKYEQSAEVRAPTKEEAAACNPRLLELIDLCQPVAIVTLGKPAAKYTPSFPEKYSRLELVHPAFILRKGESGRGGSFELERKRTILKLSAFVSKVL